MSEAPARYKRNFILLVANYVTFSAGLVFFSSSTVMPVFLRHLTDSQPLIGFAAVLFPLNWMFPQLFAARWIAGRRRRKPFLVYASIGAPAAFGILAALMFLTDPTRAGWLLPTFMVIMTILGLSDGFVGVPWLDFVGSAIPVTVRGRMMGLQDLLAAAASVGVGAIVSYFLSERAPAFPRNFAWLATFGALAYFIALLAFCFLRESASAGVTPSAPAWRDYVSALGRILGRDRVFVRLLAVRLLNGLGELSLPFYVLYATTSLGLPASVTGAFLATQMVAIAVGSMLLGVLYERYGSRLVVRLTTLIGIAAPLLALLTPALRLSGPALTVYFALVFVALGAGGLSSGALFIGYTNFVIDYCDPAERPLYLGLGNTLAGPTVLAATLGGWLLQHTSYAFLFTVTAGCLLLALVPALRLPEPRRAAVR